MKARYGFRGDDEQQKRERETIRTIAADAALGMTAGVIAAGLNATQQPAPDSGTWSRKTVERIITANPRVMARARARLRKEREQRASASDAKSQHLGQTFALDSDHFKLNDDDEVVPKTPAEIEADFERRKLAQQAATVARFDVDKDFTFYDPADITRTAPLWPSREHMDASQHIGKPELAGKDTWAKSVDEIVAKLTTARGETVHELLDQIQGQAAIKGQLRRMVYGLMREIALQRQANLSLRQQLGQKIAPERPERRPMSAQEAEAWLTLTEARERKLNAEERYRKLWDGTAG